MASGTRFPLAQVRRQLCAPCGVAAAAGNRASGMPSLAERGALSAPPLPADPPLSPWRKTRARPSNSRHSPRPRPADWQSQRGGTKRCRGNAVKQLQRDLQPGAGARPRRHPWLPINKKIISKQQLGRYHNPFTSCILWRPEHRKDIKRTCMGISDELWRRVEPLIPPRLRTEDKPYLRRQGGGRKSRNQRAVFDAVLHVLRTRCAWHALPSELGNVSTTHRHFKHWEKSGFFDALWSSGLAEHPELHGLHWQCEPRSSGSVRWRPVSGGSRGRPRKSPRDSVHRTHASENAALPAGLNSTSGELIGALQWFISRRR